MQKQQKQKKQIHGKQTKTKKITCSLRFAPLAQAESGKPKAKSDVVLSLEFAAHLSIVTWPLTKLCQTLQIPV